MSRRSIDELLRDLSRPDGADEPEAIAEAWSGEAASAFQDAVARHRLDAAASDGLRRAGAPVDPELDLVVDDDRRVRLLARRALNTASAAFDDAEVPWVVFKGPAISRLMTRPELRTFNDLDLLVPAASFGTAVDALIDAGVEEVNENWEPYLRHGVGEVPMAVSGVTVDVHWHITGLARDRSMFRLDPEVMLDRRVERTVDESKAGVFDPVDQLLHLSLHAALGGGTRLDQFRDVAVVSAGETIDWDLLVERARAAWIDGLVGHVLDRATIAGPADVPEEVVTELAGAGSVARRRRLDDSRVDGLRGLPVLLRRRRATDVGRVVVRQVLDRLPGSARRGWDFTDPQSRLYQGTPSGGASGRRAYLDAVERGAL